MEGSRVEIRIVRYRTADERSADGIETWRFFVPIFLHVGIVHFLLNMVAQVFAGSQVEKEMGKSPLSRWILMIRINPIPDRLLCWWFVRKYLGREF
jgi:membrane associated rhomboid family serine protease